MVAASAGGDDLLAAWTETQIRSEAEKLGADTSPAAIRTELLKALHDQRRRIVAMDEEVMSGVLAWAGVLPGPAAAGEGLAARKERLARAIVKINTMRFAGLSHEGLKVLAILRGVPVRGDEPVPVLIEYLRASEGMLAKLGRKRRSIMGFLAEKLVGDTPRPPAADAGPAPAGSKRLKHEIEDQGLLGGIANRLRKSADGYVQEKLDEIEARIDRKLDEIDSRLSDWRDKEIANRIRIIKITLWATVVISALSLLYLYVKSHLP